MKTCKKCGESKAIGEFYLNEQMKDGHLNDCRDCLQDRSRSRHRRLTEAGQSDQQILRRTALQLLGNKCCRCGFDDPRALQIDHIDGGGCHERRQPGYTRRQVERKIVNRTAGPDEYQLLCANCNMIKRIEEKEFFPPHLLPGRPRSASPGGFV